MSRSLVRAQQHYDNMQEQCAFLHQWFQTVVPVMATAMHVYMSCALMSPVSVCSPSTACWTSGMLPTATWSCPRPSWQTARTRKGQRTAWDAAAAEVRNHKEQC